MEKDNYSMNSSPPSSSGFAMDILQADLNSADPNCFFDHNDPFESALSSIVSSPVASSAPASQGFLLRELIGRLGSICNSAGISPESYVHNSTNTSCYSTPLNSPPKVNMRGGLAQLPSHPTLSPFSADPGFADRAARFSCFGGGIGDAELGYRSAPPPGNHSFKTPSAQESSPENAELGDSREGSSVSDQIPAPEISTKPQTETNGRKRKSIPRGKGAAASAKIAEEKEESKAKKSKAKEEQSNEKAIPEAPKDYIHVRARRGQATDSHSLAERVRREKISERMKFLQDLVPGCNKLTGKAVMLDEIINYVQSLQRQVEFLSMKLSTVNPRMDFNMEALVSKEILQSRGSLPQGVYPLDSSAPAFPYGYQQQQVAAISNGTDVQLAPNQMNGFGQAAAPPQVSGLWEDDLQSLVQMGFIGSNQTQNFHGSMGCAEMKLEL